MVDLTRFYTQDEGDIFADVRFRTVTGEDWLEYTVPQHWSQAAGDLLRDQITYPEALPAITKRVEEVGVPAWLWRSEVDDTALNSISAEWRYKRERDIRDVLHRMAGTLTYQGWKGGLFQNEVDAKIFYDEFRSILLPQRAAPELVQWHYLGLDWAYGVTAAGYVPQHKIVFFESEAKNLSALTGAGLVVPMGATEKNIARRIQILGDTLAVESETATLGVTVPIESPGSLDFITWKRE